MDNFDLEKQLKENYPNALNSLHFENKQQLYKLYKQPKRSSVGLKLVLVQVIMVIIILAICAVGTASAVAIGSTIRDSIARKATENNVHISDEELDALESRLNDMHFDEEFAGGMPEMGENENGQKYGDFIYDFELQKVYSHYSLDLYAYIYTEDNEERYSLYFEPDFTDGAVQFMKDLGDLKIRTWVYAYEEDGQTIIGKYLMYPENNENPGVSFSDIIINEQLDTGKYDEYFIDGSDVDDYEEKVKERGAIYGSRIRKIQSKNSPELYAYIYPNDIIELSEQYYESEMTQEVWTQMHDDMKKGLARSWIYAYDSDGKTILGKYLIATQLQEVYGGEENSGFYTTEELSTGAYDKYIVDGTDVDEYEEKAQQRSNSIE